MRPPKDCRHFIPVPTHELVASFCSDQTMSDRERELLRRVADHVAHTHHVTVHKKLVELNTAYDPFDPDTDDVTLHRLSAAEKQQRLNGLFSDLNWLLERAHFRHLGREEIEPLLAAASEWGIRMRVDFSAFEHVAMFVRGDGHQVRKLRNWRTWYQEEEREVPIYQRLVLVLKLRKHPALGRDVDTEHVFLKLFKDIPRADVDMLLPGARVQLNLLDRGKLGIGVLSGVGTLVFKLFNDLAGFFQHLTMKQQAAIALLTGLVGYGIKSWSDYQNTRQAYHLSLTQSLYYQNLDGNAGVLARLFGEAEEQQTRTAVLAYYCLWQLLGPAGGTAEQLESAMGLYLDRYAQVPLLCQPGEPARLLQALHLAERQGDQLRAVSPEAALARPHQGNGVSVSQSTLQV